MLRLRGGHPVVAGLAALAFLAKPQLFFTAPAFAVYALWPRTGGEGPPRDGAKAIGVAQILLIVPVVLAAGALLPRAPRASRGVLWAGCGVLLIVTPLMYQVALIRHSETFGAIVSLGIFAIVTGSLWRYRRDTARLSA